MRLVTPLSRRLCLLSFTVSLLSATTALAVDVDVQELSVQSLTCKTNRITWKRPTAATIPCGSIARYRVYRNGLLVSVLEGLNGAPLYDGFCPATSYIAPGDSGDKVNLVDEQSTHTYEVRVVDINGVEHSTSLESTNTSPACPPDPYTLYINMTLVTFADVVNAGCASYPCVVTAPPGAPFTLLKAQKDLFLASGENDRVPFAWVLQQNAPNKTISVTGEVRGWVVLPERSSYCPSPYNLPECRPAHDQMIADAIAARGTMTAPYIDGFFVHGTDSGPYGLGSTFAEAGSVRFFSKSATGLPSEKDLEHETGHRGLFSSVSSRLNAHSFSLRCPGGISVGPNLRDLSKGPTGTPGECIAGDYGDRYCTMGNQYRMFNAYSRWRLGLIDISNVYTVPGTVLDSTVLLEHLNAPSSLSSSHTKLVRVALDRNVADTSYVLEYRAERLARARLPRALPEGQVHGYRRAQRVGSAARRVPEAQGPQPQRSGRVERVGSGSSFSPNGSVQSLALSKETSPGVFENLYLDMANPVYCDPYRNLRITLLEFTTDGGVDSAKVRITKPGHCNLP